MTLVRNLVTGAINPELDTQMAEGVPIVGIHERPEVAAARNRCKVASISLYDGPLAEFGVRNSIISVYNQVPVFCSLDINMKFVANRTALMKTVATPVQSA